MTQPLSITMEKVGLQIEFRADIEAGGQAPIRISTIAQPGAGEPKAILLHMYQAHKLRSMLDEIFRLIDTAEDLRFLVVTQERDGADEGGDGQFWETAAEAEARIASIKAALLATLRLASRREEFGIGPSEKKDEADEHF